MRGYGRAVRAFSLLMIALGVALVVATLAAGGGPAAIGFLIGLCFVGVGIGRLWVQSRTER